MQTIGLIGGMSWHSTEAYYRRINEQVAARRGGHASAPIVLQSLDFEQVRDCQLREDWTGAGELLAEAARRCEDGGADLVAICTNLMHKVFPAVEAAVSVPAVHIADAVAAVAQRSGWTKLGLLGASWVMEESWYRDRLRTHHIEAVIPGPSDRAEIDRVIFEEITQGRFLDPSRERYVATMQDLADWGADAVALACTEIGLLVAPDQSPLPTIDSATAHADLLVELALAPAGVAQAEPASG
ncbi:aspartate/glutamate racemase family protein [Nocardioides sp.]|uniref:aspartate/glutamate racemase family protein n=1 Tax=Nocardioides sp. TaxID=35761 RepID=UPI002ED8B244